VDSTPAKARTHRPITMPLSDKSKLDDRAQTLANERGGRKSTPSYIMEASNFFEENRPRASRGLELDNVQ
jgi:hypothetical protein